MVFVTLKSRYITTFGNANTYPPSILTPLLNILNFALELLIIGIPRRSASLKLYN